MANKVNAPEGWYDGKLVSACTKDTENGSLILELEFDVGEDYFWAKEGIWIRNAPSGDAQKDADRAQWLKDSITRLKEVYPEAVVDGKLILVKLTNASEELKAKVVRVKVSPNGEYVKAKVYAPKAQKPKMNREDALKMAVKYSRDLAQFGIAIDEPSTMVTAGTLDAKAADIPF